jgi:hypothetical protein
MVFYETRGPIAIAISTRAQILNSDEALGAFRLENTEYSHDEARVTGAI